ncbi:uncharacterized protein MONBRDRAFT_32206 [Monosiga brevicollis MX1]|uniref:Non-specific serine/threonine protein kinase n=1 Tax=Monosiga brevicollis TaxID=81824 RepID=A9UXF7_MONBE|nr:uncharacterized protein MONBRDRAFT_32206 [Monosiga brevicollis MX1]EDQ89836.1 predicted protein [Monosiga brevicollis MX1]|eukprot:XP_001745258.1 hypothetical protein [Monosiga brevicollis MX1]
MASEVEDATIVAHETRRDDKRFTVYKIELVLGSRKVAVFHRYSEFRELYEQLKEAFPREKFKFPSKRFIGNFDPDFIKTRKRGLHEFIQRVVSDPKIVTHPAVRDFMMATPRHGRGGQGPTATEREDEEARKAAEEEDVAEDGGPSHEFDLGAAENKRATAADFEMLKVIGKGSFGKVLLGKHKKDNKLYAVKVLSKDAIVKQNEAKHVMSERNVLLGNVHHPFLVGLHFSFQTRSKLFFILDYVNGGEVFFHLQKEKRFGPLRAQFYAAEITSALGYLHSLNIVYRDLKPENILFDADGHVVLTDFGLCKENVEPGGVTSTFCGTPEYLAPEVLKRQSYGRPVDWWCLGCVTYEMMCGLPPFYSRQVHEMYERILHDKLRFPEHVPMIARQWLEALLERDPAKRLGSGDTDAEEVKTHKFFKTINFDALDRREIPPPWKPHLASDLDLSNIDQEFVNEPVPGSVVNHQSHSVAAAHALNSRAQVENLISVRVSEADVFQGFSYAGDDTLAGIAS